MLLVRKNKDWNSLPTMDSFLNDFFGNNFIENKPTNVIGKVNVSEDDKTYGISLALPGYTKEDINIEMKDDVIVVSSEIENTNEEKTYNYVKKEFSISSFERSFNLPDDVDKDNINASMENGVLSITLSKVNLLEDKTNIKKIDIK